MMSASSIVIDFEGESRSSEKIPSSAGLGVSSGESIFFICTPELPGPSSANIMLSTELCELSDDNEIQSDDTRLYRLPKLNEP